MRSILIALFVMVSEPALGETYFAHVNADNIVDQVIVADQGYINQTFVARTNEWIQTYITPGSGQPKNYAGIGFTWNPTLNCFVAPKPTVAAPFDQATCQWNVPIAKVGTEK